MANIRPVEMMFLDRLLDMQGGFVLNFSDPTFSRFFADELGCDIDDPAYALNGRSKAKRLRCFLQTADRTIVARALRSLWEYREAARALNRQPETVENAKAQLLALLGRLEGITVAADVGWRAGADSSSGSGSNRATARSPTARPAQSRATRA